MEISKRILSVIERAFEKGILEGMSYSSWEQSQESFKIFLQEENIFFKEEVPVQRVIQHNSVNFSKGEIANFVNCSLDEKYLSGIAIDFFIVVPKKKNHVSFVYDEIYHKADLSFFIKGDNFSGKKISLTKEKKLVENFFFFDEKEDKKLYFEEGTTIFLEGCELSTKTISGVFVKFKVHGDDKVYQCCGSLIGNL